MASSDDKLANFNLHLGAVDTQKLTYTELNTQTIAYQINSIMPITVGTAKVYSLVGANNNIAFYEITQKKSSYSISASTTLSNYNNNDNIFCQVLVTSSTTPP